MGLVRQELRVVGYRFRATFGRRVGGLLAIVVLIGLTSGIALGAIGGARRTQSSYPKFLASTDPSDMTFSVSGFAANAPVLTAEIARLPGVKRVASMDSPNVVPVTASGAPGPGAQAQVLWVGSTNGGLLRQDKLALVHGRMSDPNRADEMVMTASVARSSGCISARRCNSVSS